MKSLLGTIHGASEQRACCFNLNMENSSVKQKGQHQQEKTISIKEEEKSSRLCAIVSANVVTHRHYSISTKCQAVLCKLCCCSLVIFSLT